MPKPLGQGIGIFGSVISLYFESGPGKLLDTRAEQERKVRHVFAKHIDRSAAEISCAELQVSADRHSSASSAGHAVAYFRPIAAWAAKREFMCAGFGALERPALDAGPDRLNGQRVLSSADLRKILPALKRSGHDAAAKFMLWSGCRLEEACGATWGEINLEGATWAIPAARRKDTRSKNRKKQVRQRDHIIFLPRQAIKLLQELGPGKAADLIFRGERGGRLQNWDRWSKALMLATGTEGWDRHSLRRTTATMAGELGAPPHVISALLGHRNIGDQLTAGYSKARYAAEVGEVLQLVADRLQAFGDDAQDNIVLLRRLA